MIASTIRKIRVRLEFALANRNNDAKVKWLRKHGCKVGDGTRFVCDTSFAGSEPYLVDIGKNCLLSIDIQMFTHDGGGKSAQLARLF